MQARHFNREQYFNEQSYTTFNYVIPFISELMPINSETKVVEIGCGEGGNLKPFLDMGCKVVGIDLSTWKISEGEKLFENHPLKHNLTLIAKDIYDITDSSELKFDLIVMRDTLEHIPNQEKFMEHLKLFLNANGKVFFAFPPWRMPFGGHQQMCKNKFLSKLPYFHILPKPLYTFVLQLFGESQGTIKELTSIKETQISMQKFYRIAKRLNYEIEKQTSYLINPNYEIKFNLKTKKLPIILNIPYVRDFFITTFYSIASIK